jgi:UDP-hydrolysing UDP-N-acetyl-D-glucosamine 2-epimerase
LDKDKDIDLEIVLTSGIINQLGLLKEFSQEKLMVIPLINYKQTLLTMSRSVSHLTSVLSEHYYNTKPDAVIVIADRFELLSAAIAASYQNIPVIHIQGGEVSGNIDNKVRNALTALSDIHFPSCYPAAIRLKDIKNMFYYGCPSSDITLPYYNKYKKEDQIIVIFHPHTKEVDKAKEQTDIVLKAVSEFIRDKKVKCYYFLPNNDPGSKQVIESLNNNILYPIDNMESEEFLELLSKSKLIVGNSSATLRESAMLGVPAVVIGDRQEGRDVSENACFCDVNKESIKALMNLQYGLSYPSTDMYGSGNVSILIVKKIKEIIGGING